jgi:hypothetical protein
MCRQPKGKYINGELEGVRKNKENPSWREWNEA